MDHPPLPRDSRVNVTWARICCIAGVLICATVGGVVLAEYSEPFEESSIQVAHQHLANTISDQDSGCLGAIIAAGSGTRGHNTTSTRRGMQQQLEVKNGWGTDTLGREGLMKQYSSFAEYARESSQNLASLAVPVVGAVEKRFAVSIPIITIIGIQKGGTTNLRANLMMHPMVWGKSRQVHFFDRAPADYPAIGHWEGDGLDVSIGHEEAGKILSEYAQMCRTKGYPYFQRKSGTIRLDRVIVDSSPRYMFSPLAPYRIKMVRPGAKFVAVLRDPTDRYFSQLRMEMCKNGHDVTVAGVEETITTQFHQPGSAKTYLHTADLVYQPYTAICRGENASASDLWKCYELLNIYNPLYRGLYADQLERWFRVFHRSQIMFVDSSEMFANFAAVVAAVAEFAGLPKRRLTYSSHKFHSDCSEQDHSRATDYFDPGGRYEMMIKEEELFRQWYRPHNERLYKLLGRDLMWR